VEVVRSGCGSASWSSERVCVGGQAVRASVQFRHGARWGRRGRVAYAPRSGGDGRKRVEAAEERWRRAVGVSEGGLWRDVEHGTGGLLELEVGEVEVEERERERGNQVGHSRNALAMLVRKGRAITLLLASPGRSRRTKPPHPIPRMSQEARPHAYIGTIYKTCHGNHN
jgi:hypothetical protein